MGILINQIIRKMEQELMDGRLQVGEFKPKVSGCCLAATGKWLSKPEEVEAKILKGDTAVWEEIQTIQGKYEEEYSGEKVVYSPDFLTRKFQFPQKRLKNVSNLKADELYNQIIYMDVKPLKSGKIAIILKNSSGPAHYIGVTIENEKFNFFDVNEGFCTMLGYDIFERFIEIYVNDEICGLLRQHYTDFQVVLFDWDM